MSTEPAKDTVSLEQISNKTMSSRVDRRRFLKLGAASAVAAIAPARPLLAKEQTNSQFSLHTEALPADPERKLPERVRYTTDYLGKLISIEAPVDFVFKGMTDPENSLIPTLIFEHVEENGSTTQMKAYAINLNHGETLDEWKNTLIQAIKNEQATATTNFDAYVEPYVKPYPEGLGGMESYEVTAYIPGKDKLATRKYINTFGLDGERAWEVALYTDAAYASRFERIDQYAGLRASFAFQDTPSLS